jgi:hypothetical protein
MEYRETYRAKPESSIQRPGEDAFTNRINFVDIMNSEDKSTGRPATESGQNSRLPQLELYSSKLAAPGLSDKCANGNNATDNGTGNTISQTGNDNNASVNGNNNAVTENGTGNSTTINGDHDTVIESGNGNNVTVTGNNETVVVVGDGNHVNAKKQSG